MQIYVKQPAGYYSFVRMILKFFYIVSNDDELILLILKSSIKVLVFMLNDSLEILYHIFLV